MIERLTDSNLIKSLWKPYVNEIGMIFTDYVEEYEFFCYKVDGKIAGMINYEIHNKLKEVEIGVLLVLPEFRGQGISTKLIKHIFKETESLIRTLNYKLVVKAFKGLPNNKVYEHLAIDSYPYGGPKNKPYIKYILDINYLGKE